MWELFILLTSYTVKIEAPVKVIDGYVTAYSREDSCHNRNTQGECLMANGNPVREGSIACPRGIKLGTLVDIEGIRYSCDDRMASWVEKKWPNTFDIFTESDNAKEFGRTKIKISILQ